MKTGKKIRGFSLIELMIGLAIFAMFLFLAVPSIQIYLENTRIRSVAESIALGIQKTRTIAVSKSQFTEFFIAPQTFRAWTIREFNMDNNDGVPTRLPEPVETFTWGERITVTTQPPGDGTGITFNGIGRVRGNMDSNNNTTIPTINSIQVTSVLEGTRRLQIDVLMTGGIRVCDLDLPTADPKACKFVAW